MLNDGTTNLVYGLARIKRGNSTWYQHDGVGSVRAVLDGAGAVQSTTSYDPWGTPQTALTDSFGFTGELHDGDLVHLRARWYHPSTGTFTSRDPFAGFDTLPYSLHPYQYAYSNPVLLTDPSGEFVPLIIGGVVVLSAVEVAFIITAVGLATTLTMMEVCINQQQCDGLTRAMQTHVPWKQHTTIQPPRHTGNHTPAPVTPPSSPHPAPQDVPRGGNIQGTPWELDERLVCTQEGFPMPEAEDFQVTIFPAPEKGDVPVLMAEAIRATTTAGGQTFCKECQDESYRVAQAKGLRVDFPDDGTPGMFNPLYQRHGTQAHQQHYAVRNPDGTITDTTILLNIAAYSAGQENIDGLSKEFPGLVQLAPYDTFDPEGYDILIDILQQLHVRKYGRR